MTVYAQVTGVLRYATQPAANDARTWAQTWATANDARLYKSATIRPVVDLHTIPPAGDGGCTREVTLDVWVMFPDTLTEADLEILFEEIRAGVYATTGCGSTIAMAGQDFAPDAPRAG
jgi:hypothetical protein